MEFLAELITEVDVAKKLRVSLACLRRWRFEKKGPQFLKIGSLVRYRTIDIQSWLESLPVGGSVRPSADDSLAR